MVFNIAAETLAASVVTCLRESVFHNASELPDPTLAHSLQRTDLVGLYVSDRNTKGLGGPVQGHLESTDGNYDWVDFILNVGKANTDGMTGGTYGFGKTIAYIASRPRTIIVHSRAMHNGAPVSRLIACSIGSQFALDGILHTGRHWWGRNDSSEPVPLEGIEADTLAARLGMPDIAEGSLGTNILILDPDFGHRTIHQGMTFISESVLWHLWPKLVGDDRAMDIRTTLDGAEIAIPKPDSRPPLNHFVAAYSALKGEGGEPSAAVRQHEIMRYKERLGRLTTVPFTTPHFSTPVPIDDGHKPEDPDSPAAASPFTNRVCNHTVLLRSPELVVEYREGPPAPKEGIEWAGVFRADDDLDESFAHAEPPTHDSWQPSLVTIHEQRLRVVKALRDIDHAVSTQWGKPKPATAAESTSTAAVANALSHLVGTPGQGKGRPGASGGGGAGKRGPKRASIELLDAGPRMLGNQTASYLRCLVTPPKGADVTFVTVSVGVALDGATSDATLDPQLELVSAEFDGDREALKGHRSGFKVFGDEPVHAVICAKRSSASSVLWDVSADLESSTA
ncbi:hypothetical protein MUK71_03615 [Arthrobacter zhangbolii]|uniref:Uncharacterized protein n=1 Tax=Arthrobacter zhangbolii TaxID=2886936 RepID=A0A9X1M9B8_9MICC|nr:hypothetical protein [Arthrobacter zhangbolii]MCC3273272.1 hypothetical protein [Arthrobacter zhangbolii]UON92745.1 hypothetical protein MUK71_03615 [Arthrobacter zhangbolii]